MSTVRKHNLTGLMRYVNYQPAEPALMKDVNYQKVQFALMKYYVKYQKTHPGLIAYVQMLHVSMVIKMPGINYG